MLTLMALQLTMLELRKGAFVLVAISTVGSQVSYASSGVDVAQASVSPPATTTASNSTAALDSIRAQIAALKKTRDAEEAKRLIEVLLQIGEFDGYAPATVKRLVAAELPAALLIVAKNAEFRTNLRASALMAMRTIDANDADLDAGINVARADVSAGRDFLESRAALLTQWRQSRAGAVPRAQGLQPANPAAEMAALFYLKTADIRVSAEAMLLAVADGNLPAVEALLDAGVDIAAHIALSPAIDVWTYATSASCVAETRRNPIAQAAMLSLLAARGANPNRRDQGNETPLHSAARFCPLAMVRQLVGMGADVNATNASNFTALSYALILGRWDVADNLVSSGARLPKSAIKSLFMELPIDPAQLQIVQRAQQLQ